MEVIITKEANVDIVKIIGRLDTTTATSLEKEISPLFVSGAEVVFDCTELKYISSSGLRVVLMAHKKLTAAGGTLTIKSVTPVIMSVFDITGFSKILHFED